MKAFLTAFFLGSGILLAADESDNYLNFLIQIQNDANQTTHKIDDVSPEGSATALKGVTTSSVFQLWTIHRTTAEEYLLDEKTVSSYHPEASITITSQDTYSGIPRTRVDHPFQVSYTVTGLLPNDPNAQDAAKAVVLEQTTTAYAAGSFTPEGGTSTSHPQVEINNNGTTSNSMYTMIQAADLTTAHGEEVFSIYAKPDFGIEEASMLARQKVQIWPIAQGTISGINTKTNYTRLPSLGVTLIDLYPSSTTYIRIYKGEPNSNPRKPIIINTSYVNIDAAEPQNRTYLVSDLDAFIQKPGKHTVEIIHETPFGADILAQVYPMKKKGKIKVIGSMTDSE